MQLLSLIEIVFVSTQQTDAVTMGRRGVFVRVVEAGLARPSGLGERSLCGFNN